LEKAVAVLLICIFIIWKEGNHRLNGVLPFCEELITGLLDKDHKAEWGTLWRSCTDEIQASSFQNYLYLGKSFDKNLITKDIYISKMCIL